MNVSLGNKSPLPLRILAAFLALIPPSASPPTPLKPPVEVRILEIGYDGTLVQGAPVSVNIEISSHRRISGRFEMDVKNRFSMPGRFVRRMQLDANVTKRFQAVLPCTVFPGDGDTVAWRFLSEDGARVSGSASPKVIGIKDPLPGCSQGDLPIKLFSAWPGRLLALTDASKANPLGYCRSPSRAFRDSRLYAPFRTVLVSDRDFVALEPRRRKALMDAVALGMTLTLVPPRAALDGSLEKRLNARDAIIYEGDAGTVREIAHGFGRIIRAPRFSLAKLADAADPSVPLTLYALMGGRHAPTDVYQADKTSHKIHFDVALSGLDHWSVTRVGMWDAWDASCDLALRAVTSRFWPSLGLALGLVFLGSFVIRRASRGGRSLPMLLVLPCLLAVSILVAFAWPVPEVTFHRHRTFHFPHATIHEEVSGRWSDGTPGGHVHLRGPAAASFFFVGARGGLDRSAPLYTLIERPGGTDVFGPTRMLSWKRRMLLYSRYVTGPARLVKSDLVWTPGGLRGTITVTRDLRDAAIVSRSERVELGDLAAGRTIDATRWKQLVTKSMPPPAALERLLHLKIQARLVSADGTASEATQFLGVQGVGRVSEYSLRWPSAAIYFLSEALVRDAGPAWWTAGGIRGTGVVAFGKEFDEMLSPRFDLPWPMHGAYRSVVGAPPEEVSPHLRSISLGFITRSNTSPKEPSP